jgi:type III secretion protein S
MEAEMILHQTVTMTVLVLTASLVPTLAATLVGLLVSLLQALTQIQEQTLGFAVKLIAVVVTLLFTARWMGGEVYNFTIQIFDQFGAVAQ